MTKNERELIEKHFEELHAKASGITSNIKDGIRQAIKAAYMAGADYAIDMFACNWISVEDELPEYNQKVLWCWDDGLISIGRIGRVALDERHTEDGYITHWMPLPPTEGIKGNQGEISPNRIIGTVEHIKVAMDVMEKGEEQ